MILDDIGAAARRGGDFVVGILGDVGRVVRAGGDARQQVEEARGRVEREVEQVAREARQVINPTRPAPEERGGLTGFQLSMLAAIAVLGAVALARK